MSTLTDRYVHATVRAVPKRERARLGDALRGEIRALVDARIAAGESPADAERAALLELGDPEVRGARYADRPLQLIGPAFFPHWKRLLVVLLTYVPAIVGSIVLLVGVAGGDELGPAIGAGLSAAFGVALQIAFWVTLVFAIVERTAGPSAAPAWELDDLPEIPAGEHVGHAETAGQIAMDAVLIGLLVWQEVSGVIDGPDGVPIPLLDSALWSSWMPVIIAALVLEAAIAGLAGARGSWTWPLVFASAAQNLLFAVPVIWLALEDRLLDPRFVAEVDWLGEGDNLHRIMLVFAAIVLLSAVSDVGTRARAAWQAG